MKVLKYHCRRRQVPLSRAREQSMLDREETHIGPNVGREVKLVACVVRGIWHQAWVSLANHGRFLSVPVWVHMCLSFCFRQGLLIFTVVYQACWLMSLWGSPVSSSQCWVYKHIPGILCRFWRLNSSRCVCTFEHFTQLRHFTDMVLSR